MKRIVLILIIAAAPSMMAAKTYLRVHTSDGSVTAYDIGEITKITFDLTGVSNCDLGKLNGALRPLLLMQNRPNPFAPSTTIDYTLPQRTAVELSIYNITGQAVRTLVRGVQDAGRHSLTWDGRDERGTRAANGTYLYQLRAGGQLVTKKMLFLK